MESFVSAADDRTLQVSSWLDQNIRASNQRMFLRHWLNSGLFAYARSIDLGLLTSGQG
jgi:hypothetical protein